MFSYKSFAEIIDTAGASGQSISQVVLEDQCLQMEISEAQLLAQMKENLEVMKASAAEGIRPGVRSVSRLTGGDGHLAYEYFKGDARPLGGSFCAKATAIAVGIQEYNAAMGKIVAAPTAGASGVLPAGIITMMEERAANEISALMALITAGAVGMVIANNASISGAQGGCQAECGSAAAMTAAALTEMQGASNEAIAHAAAIALQNLMGLVCDPVAGLVEVPCILRNAGAMAVAINSADLALSGVKSIIPIDEVITAMGEVGSAMHVNLRETSQGGLAATPTGQAIQKRLFGG